MLSFIEFLKLNEMSPPMLEPRELPHFMTKMPFYSNDTITDNYIVLHDQKISARGNIIIAIKKDKSSAFIGKTTKRPTDKKLGVYIYGRVEFKTPFDVHDKIIPTTDGKILQIGGVEIIKELTRQGYGYLLYFNLIKAGYSIICDNTQYFGGQTLWKKIAKESKFNNYKVYVLDNGILRKDANGKLVYYDGSNIEDSDLWSNDYKKYHTLFLATTRDLS